MSSELEFALRLADQADEILGRYVCTGSIPFEVKADGSPVTLIDFEVEEALREMVRAERPGEGFLGEEVGETSSGSRRWIVDGIDGTRAFAMGRREWGTLVAMEEDGEVQVGVATSPGLTRRWWAARGEGAWIAPLGDASRPERLEVATRRGLSGARAVVLPPADESQGWRREVAGLVGQVGSTPSVGGHGPLVVAAGDCDLSVHLWGGQWDHAPFVVIVEEAGGRFVDLWGGRRLDTGTAVFGVSAVVTQILEYLSDQGLPPPPAVEAT